uniref:Uncharacterized protein n=1 Tax=Oryza nivara TaxID=4536 RepID=A0A0E0HP04_ORYNI
MATGGDLMRMQLFLAEVIHLVLLLVWGWRPELRMVARVEEEDGGLKVEAKRGDEREREDSTARLGEVVVGTVRRRRLGDGDKGEEGGESAAKSAGRWLSEVEQNKSITMNINPLTYLRVIAAGKMKAIHTAAVAPDANDRWAKVKRGPTCQ